MKIAVIGAGIAGLSAAWALRDQGDVVVYEASDRAGGNIQTEVVDDCLVEWGPNGFLDNEPATLRLVDELGLTERLVRVREAAALRYIWRAGRLRALPTKPLQFAFGDYLPLAARMRAACERFIPKGDATFETVHEFAARRLGEGAASVLIDALVTGVWAGDAKRLSLKSTFPKLHELEAEHGGLMKGAKGRGFGPKGQLTSFDGGLRVLVDALRARVEIQYGVDARTLDLDAYDQVILSVPARRAGEILGGEVSALFGRIATAPVAVVASVFDQPLDVPEAFGFLVPRDQGLRMLGTTYDTSMFEGRAPDGVRMFRTMLGGRRDPDAVKMDDGAIAELVLSELRQAWGPIPGPRSVHVFRHLQGIPQYERGHALLLDELTRVCPPHVRLTGSSYRGVALNKCVREARELCVT
jgi:oxygen-dependent protoporphyrinogen oxidase